MRWFPLLLTLVLVAGCAQPAADPQSPAPGGDVPPGEAAAPAGAAPVPVGFAGQSTSKELSFDDTFAPDQWCQVRCSSNEHLHDLAADVPAGVPVQVRAEVTGSGDFYAFLTSSRASFSSYLTQSTSGSFLLEVTLLRSAEGTLGLAVMYVGPTDADVGAKLHTTVSIRSDPARVPPGIPVALTLRPGDVVNATGEGVKGLYLLPPKGPALLDEEAPASLRVPADAPAGTYVAIPFGTAAAQLVAPNQTLQPRSYAYHQGEPRDVPAGQAFTWEEAIPDAPVRVGLRLDCKEAVADYDCWGGFRTTGDYAVAAPDGADVFQYKSNCQPVCDLTLAMGYYSRSYYGPFLNEHLAPGTFRATANVPQGNAMQARVVWSTIEPA